MQLSLRFRLRSGRGPVFRRPQLVFPPLMVNSALALLVGAQAGCSWLFVQPVPIGHPRGGVIECTSSRAAPVLDTLFTGTNVVSAIYVASQDNVANKEQAVGFGLGVATLWALSAVYGYQNTSACEEAQNEGASSGSPYTRTLRLRAPVPTANPTGPTGAAASPRQPPVGRGESIPTVNVGGTVVPEPPAGSSVRQQADQETP
jgi:hypothetical protein